MSDPANPPPSPMDRPASASAPAPKGQGLGWFLAISGGVLLFLTLGCIFAANIGNKDFDLFIMTVVVGSPTLILGGVFLWLGRRRLRR